VTRVRVSDLGADAQAQIAAAVGRHPANPVTVDEPAAAPRARRRVGAATFRCHVCGLEHHAYAPAERHSRDSGHHRLVWVL
jgi:hypothetical protein